MSTDITAAAIRAVNAPSRDARDHALDPAGKVRLMQPPAGPLIRILSDQALATLVQGYARDDAAALEAQRWYRIWHWSSIACRYGMILIGILALTFLEAIGEWLGALLAVQLALLIGAMLIGVYMRATQPLERWMRLRAYAEVKRLAFFEFLARQEEPSRTDELALLPLQLEYVVRYLLEPQLQYFQLRGGTLGRATSLGALTFFLLTGLIAYTAAQLVFVLSVQVGLVIPAATFDPLSAMGRASGGAAFAVLLASTTLSRLDERNALRFRQTGENLEKLADHYLVHARRAAARGDRPAVLSFVRLITEQVGFGANDWLSLEDLNAISAAAVPQRPAPDPVTARAMLTARMDAEAAAATSLAISLQAATELVAGGGIEPPT